MLVGSASVMQSVRNVISVCAQRAKLRPLTIVEDSAEFVELVNALLSLLRIGLLYGESFLRFFVAAAGRIPRTPEIHDIIDQVMRSHDSNIASMPTVEKEKVYLLLSLRSPGSLMRSVQRLYRVSDVVRAYYLQETPFLDETFLNCEVGPLLMQLARIRMTPPGVEDGLRMMSRSENPLVFQSSQVPSNSATLGSSSSDAPQLSGVAVTETLTAMSDAGTGLANVAPALVIVKKKKRSKQAAEVGIQVDISSEANSRKRFTTSTVQCAPSTANAAIQTLVAASARPSPLVDRSLSTSPNRSADLRRWEDHLVQRENALALRLVEIERREGLLANKDRTQSILSGLGQTSGSPTNVSRSNQQLFGDSSPGVFPSSAASPLRIGTRSVSVALAQAIDHRPKKCNERECSVAPGDISSPVKQREPLPTRLSSITDAPSPVQRNAQPEGQTSAVVPSNIVAAPCASLRFDIQWVDIGEDIGPLDAGESQGWCCAGCGLPLSCDCPTPNVNFRVSCGEESSSPPQRFSASSTIRKSALTFAATVKDKVASVVGGKDANNRSHSEEGSSADTTRSKDSQHRYRYCHYTAAVYCHECQAPTSVAVIPSRLISNWDCQEYSVCNYAQNFLRSVVTEPCIAPAALGPILPKAPRVFAARGLRQQLRIIGAILEMCPSAKKSAELMTLSRSAYSSLNELYSIQDLLQLHDDYLGKHAKDEGNEVNLLQRLKAMRDVGAVHCGKQCSTCLKVSSQSCSLCSDAKPLLVFDTQKSTVCESCHMLFHVGCWELSGHSCPKCGRGKAQ